MGSRGSSAEEGVEIRRFDCGDEVALFRVHFTAIHDIASRDYSPEQIEAWAPTDTDMVMWADRMHTLRPFVAELDGEIVGYADLQPHGLIDHFYVSGRHPRRGIGKRLMVRIHEEAQALGLMRLTSHVSRTAEPLFTLHGFRVIERAFPVRRGVTLENALMQKAGPVS